MPKSSPIQTDFSAGELGPLVEGRVDAEKHKTGLEFSQNYIPTLEGPLDRRPGTKRVASVKDPSKPPRFIPFKFNNLEQYILEFGDKYIRFFTDEGQIVTSGSSYLLSGVTSLSNNLLASVSISVTEVPTTQVPFVASRTSYRLKNGEIGPTFTNAVVLNTSFVAAGTILEIPSYWDYNMIQNVGYTQKGDTLWIFHSSIPTYTLQRFTPQDWDLKCFNHKDGPYLPLNTSASDGDNANVGLSLYWDAYLDTTSFGKQSIYNPRLFTHSSVKIANVISNSGVGIILWTQSQHGFVENQKVWITGTAGATEVNNGSSQINVASFPKIEPNYIRESSTWVIGVLSGSSFFLKGTPDGTLSSAYVGSGIVFPALFTGQDAGRRMAIYVGGHRYYGTLQTCSSLSGISSLNIVGEQTIPNAKYRPHPICSSFEIDIDNDQIPVASTIINIWQMGVFTQSNGYPSTGTYHQNRLIMSGVPNRPTEWYGSKIGDYRNFAINEASSLIVTDANALQFNLVSNSQDLIQWCVSGTEGLYFGSNSAEFLVSPSKLGESITPTNINNDIIGYYGSALVQPVRQGDAIIYVQNSARKVREIKFFANLQSHKLTDLTRLSNHVTLPGVARLATQKETYPVVWAYLNDGSLVSMTYEREENSQATAGWVHHKLGGQSDPGGAAPVVKAMEVIRDSTGKYEQLWMAVQRYINGTSDVIVEYMNEPYRHNDSTQKQRDAYLADCGATYDSSIVITGITLGSALVSATNHGFARNDLVLINDVVGLNSSLININGVIVGSNLINDKVFVVGSTTANNFFLQDFSSSIILTNTYSPYFSGGKARKLVTSVGGLTWLKNETVDILGDGAIQGQAIVNSAGVVSIAAPGAAVWQIGYSYKSRVKTLMKENGSATGSAVGMLRNTYQVAFRLKSVGDLSYGGYGFDSLHSANFGNGDEMQANKAIPLYSGMYRDGIESDTDFYGQIFFEQGSLLPGMVQSITFMMDENDL